jgi:hypothetical protein
LHSPERATNQIEMQNKANENKTKERINLKEGRDREINRDKRIPHIHRNVIW